MAKVWDAKRIKQLRERLGWTQQRLAQACSVAISTVSRWETNDRAPSRLAIEKLESIERDAA